MIHEIKYTETEFGACGQECPHEVNSNTCTPSLNCVSSSMCRYFCEYFISIDETNEVVVCNFPEKQMKIKELKIEKFINILQQDELVSFDKDGDIRVSKALGLGRKKTIRVEGEDDTIKLETLLTWLRESEAKETPYRKSIGISFDGISFDASLTPCPYGHNSAPDMTSMPNLVGGVFCQARCPRFVSIDKEKQVVTCRHG